MKRGKKIQPIILKLMLLFFSITVSASVIPSHSAGIHCLSGNIQAEVLQIPAKKAAHTGIEQKPLIKVYKTVRLQNLYTLPLYADPELLLLVIMFSLCAFLLYSYFLPKLWDPITLKVRMND